MVEEKGISQKGRGMNRINKIFFSLLILLIFISINIALGEEKHKIYVNHSGDDSIGIRVSYEVKEKISSSERYELINKTMDTMHFMIRISSISINDYQSAISIAYLVYFSDYISYFITQDIGVTGSLKTQETANLIVANADKYISDYSEKALMIIGAYLLEKCRELERELKKRKYPFP